MKRIEKIRALPEMANIDALLFRNGNNRFYLTGFRSSAGMVMITKEKAFFFTDSRYIEAAQTAVKDAEVIITDQDHREQDRISEIVSAYGVKRLGIEESMSHAEFLALDEKTDAELVASEGMVKSLREIKDEDEKNAVLSAQAITERVFEEVLRLIAPGVTEREIAAEIVYRQLKYGAEGMSFDPIVVTGAKSSMPHGTPGDIKIQVGDFVTMDFGCVKNGYCSDMTRTVAIGHATDEMRRVYQVVLDAQCAGIELARAGVIGRDIDAAGRQVITDAGYGEFFGHGFGHGVGIEVHEGPNASLREERPMPVGAIISAEPGIYLPGRFGVRIEDLLYITQDGNENLTKVPKDLLVI